MNDLKRNRPWVGSLILATSLAMLSPETVRAGGYFCLAMAREGSRLQDEFKSIDANQDGVLTLSEYRVDASRGLPKASKKYAFLILDTDHDGRLSSNEYALLPWQVAGVHCVLHHSPIPIKVGPEKLRNVSEFAQLDRNDDLRLTLPEFLSHNPDEGREEAKGRQFGQLDEDRNGVLSLVEFSKRAMERVPPKPQTFEGSIDAALLSLAPPLSGVVYAPGSGHAIEILVRLAQKNARSRPGDGRKEITIGADDEDQFIDTDGDGQINESECWQYLYQNRPGQAALRLAYLSSRAGAPQICVLDEKGVIKTLEMAPARAHCSSPQLSPDGRWIAFHSQLKSKKPGLFVIRSAGGKPRHLSEGVTRFLGWQFAWSPDSKRIAFLAHPGKTGADIHVVTIATGIVARLTTGGARAPAWSPDGTSIAFMAWTGQPHAGLCVMKSDGTDQRQLYRETSARDSFPSWSPDSKTIAFQSYRKEGKGLVGEVFLIAVNGGNPKKLLDEKFSVWNPSWSPDGTRIAVRTGAGGWGLDVVDVTTRVRTRCAEGHSPFFWVDANQLVFEAGQKEKRDIFGVTIGSEPVNLTNHPGNDRLPKTVGPNRFGALVNED